MRRRNRSAGGALLLRYRAFLRRLPPRNARHVASAYSRLDTLLASVGNPGARGAGIPYWILLPSELAALWEGGAGGSRRARGALADILWAQFCLFMFIRLQDDLLDGDCTEPSLLFVADLFYLEAEKTFRRHLGSSARFARCVPDCVEITAKAVLEVHRLQRSPSSPELLLPLPSAVNAVFKPALLAICLLHGKSRLYPKLERAYDAFALAGQLLDDYRDLEEDLRNGRANLVAQLYLERRNSGKRMPARHLTSIRGAMRKDGGARCFGPILRMAEEAEKCLAGHRTEPVDGYIATYRRFLASESRMLRGEGSGKKFRDWI